MRFLICGLLLVSAVYGGSGKKSDRKRELDLGYGPGYTQGYSGPAPGVGGIVQEKGGYNFGGYSSGYIPVNAGGVHQGNYGVAQHQNQPQEIQHEGRFTHITLHRQIQIPQPYPVPVAIHKQVQAPVHIPVHVKVDKPYQVQVQKPYPVHIEKPVHVKYEKIVQVPVPQVYHVNQPAPLQKPVYVNNVYGQDEFYGNGNQGVIGGYHESQASVYPVQKTVYVNNAYPQEFYGSGQVIEGYNGYQQQDQHIGNYQAQGGISYDANFGQGHSVVAAPQLSENVSGGYASHSHLGGVSGSEYSH